MDSNTDGDRNVVMNHVYLIILGVRTDDTLASGVQAVHTDERVANEAAGQLAEMLNLEEDEVEDACGPGPQILSRWVEPSEVSYPSDQRDKLGDWVVVEKHALDDTPFCHIQRTLRRNREEASGDLVTVRAARAPKKGYRIPKAGEVRS